MLPIYQPDIGDTEKAYVMECLDTGWISSRGSFVNRFESAFGAFVGADHVTSVNNGTTALHLAMAGLGLGPGDEVIVPTFTYVASVNAMSFVGATPVFVDCDRATWQMDPVAVERAVTDRTRAIMAVHLYGQAADMEALCQIAARHGLRVIEDCAEAFGTRIGDRHVGTFGDVATFSFFGNKTITTGEGGMVIARDRELMDEMRLLKSQYVSPVKRYWHDRVGYNFRMTNICAAIGLAQLERAQATVARKRAIADLYHGLLGAAGLETLREAAGTTHSYWMNCVLVPDGADRDAVMLRMEERGIESRPTFYPVHTMPMHSAWPTSGNRFPVSDELGRRGINLPSWPGLTDDQVREVCSVLVEACLPDRSRRSA